MRTPTPDANGSLFSFLVVKRAFGSNGRNTQARCAITGTTFPVRGWEQRMHRPFLSATAEREQPLFLQGVVSNDTASMAGTGTPSDAASSARVPTALRSMTLVGMSYSRGGDVGLALRWEEGEASAGARGELGSAL